MTDEEIKKLRSLLMKAFEGAKKECSQCKNVYFHNERSTKTEGICIFCEIENNLQRKLFPSSTK